MIFGKRFANQADMFAIEVAGKANGLITFYQRLEAQDQLKKIEYDEVSKMLMANVDMPMLSYFILTMSYYLSKKQCCIEEIYSELVYPSHQERIETAQKYLAQK